MKLLLIISGLIAIAILALLVVGLSQPLKHSITCSVHLDQKPEAVFAIIDRFEELPLWSTAVEKVKRVSNQDGSLAARVTFKWGHLQMIMRQLERTPPTRLVTQMEKEGGFVLGTWTYEVLPEDNGCRVYLTEDGEIVNPFYRAIGRIRGLDTNVRQTLHDLAQKFGQSAEVQGK